MFSISSLTGNGKNISYAFCFDDPDSPLSALFYGRAARDDRQTRDNQMRQLRAGGEFNCMPIDNLGTAPLS
jgi:hypothetical protein